MDFSNPADLADHREACNLCAECEEFRAFGECSRCGGDSEAVGADELSTCCGSPCYFPRPIEDGPERFL